MTSPSWNRGKWYTRPQGKNTLNDGQATFAIGIDPKLSHLTQTNPTIKKSRNSHTFKAENATSYLTTTDTVDVTDTDTDYETEVEIEPGMAKDIDAKIGSEVEDAAGSQIESETAEAENEAEAEAESKGETAEEAEDEAKIKAETKPEPGTLKKLGNWLMTKGFPKLIKGLGMMGAFIAVQELLKKWGTAAQMPRWIRPRKTTPA